VDTKAVHYNCLQNTQLGKKIVLLPSVSFLSSCFLIKRPLHPNPTVIRKIYKSRKQVVKCVKQDTFILFFFFFSFFFFEYKCGQEPGKGNREVALKKHLIRKEKSQPNSKMEHNSACLLCRVIHMTVLIRATKALRGSTSPGYLLGFIP
jgi:hypothetical protein